MLWERLLVFCDVYACCGLCGFVIVRWMTETCSILDRLHDNWRGSFIISVQSLLWHCAFYHVNIPQLDSCLSVSISSRISLISTRRPYPTQSLLSITIPTFPYLTKICVPSSVWAAYMHTAAPSIRTVRWAGKFLLSTSKSLEFGEVLDRRAGLEILVLYHAVALRFACYYLWSSSNGRQHRITVSLRRLMKTILYADNDVVIWNRRKMETFVLRSCMVRLHG